MVESIKKKIEQNRARVLSFRLCRDFVATDPKTYAMIYDRKTYRFKLLKRIPNGHVLSHQSKAWDPDTAKEIG